MNSLPACIWPGFKNEWNVLMNTGRQFLNGSLDLG